MGEANFAAWIFVGRCMAAAAGRTERLHAHHFTVVDPSNRRWSDVVAEYTTPVDRGN
jgi:hypothetical protein